MKKIIYRILFLMMLLIPVTINLQSFTVSAVEWIDDDPKNEDDFIQETDEKIKDVSSSVYACVFIIAIAVAGIMMLIVAVRLRSKDVQKRTEAKEHFIHLMIALICIFSISTVISIAVLIGKSIKF